MAIAFGSLLDSLGATAGAVNATSYTSASISPAANTLVIAVVEWDRVAINTTPTVSGGGVTGWSSAQDQVNFAPVSAPERAMCWFWAFAGSFPGSGAVLVDFSGETQVGCNLHVFTLTGTHTTAPRVQGVTNRTADGANATTLSATLGSALQTGSATLTFLAAGLNVGFNVRASWTEIEDTGHGSPNSRLESQYRLSPSETTGSGDKTGGGTTEEIAIIVVEIAIAPAAGQTIAVGQAQEKDTAQAITAALTGGGGADLIAVGQAQEVDTARTVAWAPKRRLADRVIETDQAQALTVSGGASLFGLGIPSQRATVADITNLSVYPLTGTVTVGKGDLILVSIAHWSTLANVNSRIFITDSVGTLRWARIEQRDATGVNNPGVALFAAQARAAFSGTLTVNFGLAQRGCIAFAHVITGASRAMPVRYDNRVSSLGTGTTATSTLPLALASPVHYHWCLVAHQMNETTVMGAGFTEPSDTNVLDGAIGYGFSVQWKENDLTCDPSWATSSNYAMISAEIQEPAYLAAESVDRPDPLWLVELTANAVVYRYATRDLSALAQAYQQRVVGAPIVTRRLVDVRWGVVEVQDVTIELANLDGGLIALYLTELAGEPLVLKRYDDDTGYLATEWTGIVTQARLTRDRLILSGTSLDRSVFETQVPDVTVETDAFPNAVDLGMTIPVVPGNTFKLQLPYVNDDILGSIFDYVVGHGVLSVIGLWRNAPGSEGNRLVAIDFFECIRTAGGAATSWAEVARFDYPGYTNIRFILRQGIEANPTGGLHTIYADIQGMQDCRNFARFIRRLVESEAWGLDKTVNAASFTAAEAALPQGTSEAYKTVQVALAPAVYYRLDETTGTQAADSSGNARHATYTGSPTLGVAGPPLGGQAELPNRGVSFENNIAKYVGLAAATADAVNHTTLGTIIAWYKPDALSAFSGIVEKVVGGVISTQWCLFQQGTDLIFQVKPSTTGVVNTSAALGAADVDTWIFLVATYSTGATRLYRDGVLVASGSYTSPITTGSGTLSIGKLTGAFPGQGDIDEVAVIPGVVLTAAQVKALYDAAWSVGPLLCDGAMREARQAQDVLRELLMVRGMRLGLNGAGEWTLTVDAPTNNIRLRASDDRRTLVDFGERASLPLEDRVKKRVIEYREDYIGDKKGPRFIFKARRTVNAGIGRNRRIKHRFLRSTEAADAVADYLAGVDLDSQESVTVTLPQEARALGEGDLVELTETALSYDEDVLAASELHKHLEMVDAVLRPRGWESYFYTAAALPADASAGTADDLSRTTPVAATGLTLAVNQTVMDSQGVVSARIRLDFTTPTTNITHTNVLYRVAGASFYSIGAVATAFGAVNARLEGLAPGIAFDFAVQVVNSTTGLVSPLTELLAQVTATDPTVPVAPSPAPTVSSPKPGSHLVIDNAAPPLDWGYTILSRAASNSSAASTPVQRGKVRWFLDQSPPYATQRWYFLQHVDNVGNVSAFSASGTAGTGGALPTRGSDIDSAGTGSGVATDNVVADAVTNADAAASTSASVGSTEVVLLTVNVPGVGGYASIDAKSYITYGDGQFCTYRLRRGSTTGGTQLDYAVIGASGITGMAGTAALMAKDNFPGGNPQPYVLTAQAGGAYTLTAEYNVLKGARIKR